MVRLALRVCLGSSALALGPGWACPGLFWLTLAAALAPAFAPTGMPAMCLIAVASAVLVVLVPPVARSVFGPGLRWQRPGCSWPQARHRGCSPQVLAVVVVLGEDFQARGVRGWAVVPRGLLTAVAGCQQGPAGHVCMHVTTGMHNGHMHAASSSHRLIVYA